MIDLLKASNYYGLVSKVLISAPASSCMAVDLPYYPGCLYIAYQAEDGVQVIVFAS